MIIPAVYIGLAMMISIGTVKMEVIYKDLNVMLPRSTQFMTGYWMYVAIVLIIFGLSLTGPKKIRGIPNSVHYTIWTTVVTFTLYALFSPLFIVCGPLNPE